MQPIRRTEGPCRTLDLMTQPDKYRAASSAFLVFGVVCGLMALLLIAAALLTRMPWAPVLLPIGAYLFVCLWLSRFKLTFAADHLTYSSLFAGDRSVPYDAIASVKPAARTGPLESPLTVTVSTKSGETVRINAKIFPREGVKRLLSIGEHAA